MTYFLGYSDHIHIHVPYPPWTGIFTWIRCRKTLCLAQYEWLR